VGRGQAVSAASRLKVGVQDCRLELRQKKRSCQSVSKVQTKYLHELKNENQSFTKMDLGPEVKYT
jgi:hypothetical protein